MKCPRCGCLMRVLNTWDSGTVRKRRQVCFRCRIEHQTSERIIEEKFLEKSDVVAIGGNESEKTL